MLCKFKEKPVTRHFNMTVKLTFWLKYANAYLLFVEKMFCEVTPALNFDLQLLKSLSFSPSGRFVASGRNFLSRVPTISHSQE